MVPISSTDVFFTSWRTFWHHDTLFDVMTIFDVTMNFLMSWRIFEVVMNFFTSWRIFWCHEIFSDVMTYFWRHDVCLTSWHIFSIMTNFLASWRIFLHHDELFDIVMYFLRHDKLFNVIATLEHTWYKVDLSKRSKKCQGQNNRSLAQLHHPIVISYLLKPWTKINVKQLMELCCPLSGPCSLYMWKFFVPMQRR